MRNLKTPVVLLALLQIALGILAARAYIGSHNTLYNNGRWTSTKTTLDGGIIGAQSFVFNLQGLARGRLNPSSWFGYQEVVSNRKFDPASIELDLFVGRDAHLTIQFGRADGTYTGLRFSSSERFPPALVVATSAGEFLEKVEVRQLRRARPGRAHRLRIDFTEPEDGFSVVLNGKKAKRFRREIARPMQLGIRGSSRATFVDNIVVGERDGSIWRETFDRPANWRLVYLISILTVLGATLLVFLGLRRWTATPPKFLLFYLLMFSGVLLIATALYLALIWRKSEFYPNANERLERRQAAYADAGTDRMLERVRSRAQPTPTTGVQRIFFIGSSQTRGSGAAAPEDTLAAQTERLLNERAGEQRFECLNVAVRAYDIARMRADLENHWSDWGPAVAILNAGYNDRSTSTADWKRELRELIAAARSADIRLVVIPEASSVVHPWPALDRVHKATRQVARRARLPVIEMHSHLQEHADDGFLWWDWVHLTSYGQQLFAEHLADQLIARKLIDLE